jgi:D-beta-D-heptose 7-phosphate kinase / D-beta-D-heptose 1-phosphate adenosyltransferase
MTSSNSLPDISIAFDPYRFSQCRILVIGDLMIDEYLWGEVDRISPEAPVQIVEVNREEFTLGGAGNVIHNLVVLGAEVSAVGVVGAGYDGDLLIEMLKKLNVNIDGIVQDSHRLTTRKTRIIASSQHVLRIDRETRKEVSRNTYELIVNNLENQISRVDMVLVSDYGKGTLTRPLLSWLVECCKRKKKMIIVDPKGLDFTKYSGVTLLTPNKKEASLASNLEITDDDSLFRAATLLLEKVNLERLLITCGKDGMVLFEKNAKPYRIHTEAKQVYDVSGAGDTVLSVLGLALATGATFQQAASLANMAAGIVVGKIGTATITQKELASAMASDVMGMSFKYKDISELNGLILTLRKKGKRIVLTNGCFDLVHQGHIRLLSESKKLGDILIVAIDDDLSVRKLKGPGRPIINQNNRVGILSALDSVDYVVVFSSDSLLNLIEIIGPDVLTKGSNYASEEVSGRQLVEKQGGVVRLIPVTEDISSSTIIDSIKNSIN